MPTDKSRMQVSIPAHQTIQGPHIAGFFISGRSCQETPAPLPVANNSGIAAHRKQTRRSLSAARLHGAVHHIISYTTLVEAYMSEKQTNLSTGRGGKRPGAGRPKGSVDQGNAAIREMIVQALHGVGGVEYLEKTARSHPAAFMALIGKVMPLQVTGANDEPIKLNIGFVGTNG